MLNKRGLCQWEIDLEFLRVDSKGFSNYFEVHVVLYSSSFTVRHHLCSGYSAGLGRMLD